MSFERSDFMNEPIPKIAVELLEMYLQQFDGRIALASSFSAEDQVLLDMMSRITEHPAVFTLDTGRLPQETYDLIEITREAYKVNIEILLPDSKQLELILNAKGPNLFYKNIEDRKLCCQVRKVYPLKKKLATLDAWICGLRSEQSLTRACLKKVEIDQSFNIIKVSPLADWSSKQVWDYIRANNVPYNKLHDMGYSSIGCACCTRAVKTGEDIRAGRWWWERPEHKECGLHCRNNENKD